MLTISGHSDDLIELDGDISEEFYIPAGARSRGEGKSYLAFSNGTVITIEYTDEGVWRIHPIVNPNNNLQIVQCPGDCDDDNYSDVATLEGVSWVVKGEGFVSNRK